MKDYAVVTGADGCMGTEIARAVARQGYHVVMACCNLERAHKKRSMLVADTGNEDIEVMFIDLASLQTVKDFAVRLQERHARVALLMNNAGILETEGRTITVDGLERTVSVNYVGHYLLTRLLLPMMHRGSRIVSMASLTYRFGRLYFPEFFTLGCRGFFWRIFPYSNTKLALTMFTRKLAQLTAGQGITVNCADPGIVSTDIIAFKMWFDKLTDIFFRPIIRTPAQGAATAVHLLLSPEVEGESGGFYASCKRRRLSGRYADAETTELLWTLTEQRVERWL